MRLLFCKILYMMKVRANDYEVNMMHFTVLIADDEPMPRRVLQEYIPWSELSVEQVCLATDGAEAVEQARKFRPEIIISDIKMPHLNGLEMAAAVREFLPDCQFIFLSGYSDKEYLKGAIRLKAANYVEKPLNLEEITEAVREITTQLLCQAKPTPEELFFLGGRFPDKSLNAEVFGGGEVFLGQLEDLIRHDKKEEAFFALRRLHEKISRCQGSAPEELRHLYCQILLLFLHAAENRNIRTLSEQADRVLYACSRQETLTGLQDILMQTAQAYFAALHPACPDIASQVESYLESHYRDCSLTVQNIAQDLGFTNTYLCAAYKKSTGKTVNQRLTEIRLSHAKQLLVRADRKLYQVANAVGYGDAKYFVKLFTREMGLSPREYQKRHAYEE